MNSGKRWDVLLRFCFFFIVKLPRDYFYMLMYTVSFQEENIICDNFQYWAFRLFIFCREQVCGLSLGPSCGALVEGFSHRELRTEMCKAGKGPGNTPLMSTQDYVWLAKNISLPQNSVCVPEDVEMPTELTGVPRGLLLEEGVQKALYSLLMLPQFPF